MSIRRFWYMQGRQLKGYPVAEYNLDNLRYLDLFDFEGKTAFLRLDLNVPLTNHGEIRDDARIRAALPTLEYLRGKKANVVIASHLGRPKGRRVDSMSLQPVAKRLRQLLGHDLIFVPDALKAPDATKTLQPGEALMLENTRFYAGEKDNDRTFAAQISQGCNMYINDAFGTMHRAHASTAAIAELFDQKGAGFLVREELKALRPLSEGPQRPFVVLLGGAKTKDKIGLIRHLLSKIDRLVIGGGMAFTFLKALGHDIGRSLCEEELISEAGTIMEEAKQQAVEMVLPHDFRLADDARVVESIGENEVALDIGPASAKRFAEAIKGAATLFWNGPMGQYENRPFMEGTLEVARAVADSHAEDKTVSVIGGGDTLAAFQELGILDKVNHASTGGGATLEFLEGRPLPGLEALLK